MNRLTASLAAAAMVGTCGLAAAEPAAAAKKYTACVKKSTGQVRILLGKSKKCKKGWKKTSWTKSGPRGAKGSVGPSGAANSFGVVVDADGALVGQSVGSFPIPITIFPVLRDGGVFVYYPNGLLVPLGLDPFYDNATCTGVPFLAADEAVRRDAILQDPTVRVVYRTVTGVSFGPASAYKPDGTSTAVVNQVRWARDEAGVCQAEVNFTGFRLPLVSVPAPPDVKGPLRFA